MKKHHAMAALKDPAALVSGSCSRFSILRILFFGSRQ